MTEKEREEADARARKMAELDPGLCVSGGGEPYRELIGTTFGPPGPSSRYHPRLPPASGQQSDEPPPPPKSSVHETA